MLKGYSLRIPIMTEEERKRIDDLYWVYFAKMGWKQHIVVETGIEMVQVVLVHEPCGKVLDHRTLNSMTKDKAVIGRAHV